MPHNHLQEEVLVPYVEGAIGRALAAGVGEMWCNGTAEDDWQAVCDLAATHPEVVPFFGLHPWFVRERSPDWLARLRYFLDAAPSAIGEIGPRPPSAKAPTQPPRNRYSGLNSPWRRSWGVPPASTV